jgi:hypothetical protein
MVGKIGVSMGNTHILAENSPKEIGDPRRLIASN